MALTSLEAITEKLQENRQTQLEDILRVSGSSAIAKNEYGITTIDENNIATSLVFKTLDKPKYDNTELVKAIDVNIKELKPNIPVPKKDLVPKPLYDEQLAINEDLNNQIASLTLEIDSLNSTIIDLRSQVETETNNRINIEQSNDALANQLDSLTQTITDFTNQIQSAIQKSVDESILRASLQAQNVGYKAQIEALIKQIDSLNSIIEGLQAQLGAVQQQQAIQNSTQNLALAAGGDVVNDVAIVVLDGSTKADSPRIWFRIHSDNQLTQFVRGEIVKIKNNDTVDVVATLSMPTLAGGKKALLITGADSSNNRTLTIKPGEEAEIKLNMNVGATTDLDSRPKSGPFGGHTSSAAYGGGSLKVAILRKSNNTTKDITYDWGFERKHPKSW